MPAEPVPLPGRHNADKEFEHAISFLEGVLTGHHPRNFAIRLWNGLGIGPGQGVKARFTMIVTKGNNRSTCC